MKKQRKKFNINIFTKLMTVSLLFILVPLLIVSSVANLSFSNTIENETITNMQASVDIKLDLLQELLDSAKREVNTIANESNAISILSGMHNSEEIAETNELSVNKNLVTKDLKNILEDSKGLYENLFYTDSNGVVVADALEGKALGVDISKRDYFISASKGGKITVSDVIVSSSSGNSIISIVAPVYDSNNKFIGVAGMPIDFTKLTKLLIKRTDGINYNFTIFNSKGVVIAHEDKKILMKANMTNESESQKRLFEKMKKEPTSYGFYNWRGEDKVMAYTAYKELNWYITASMNINYYLKPINNLKIVIRLIGLLCLAISIVFVFLFSRSIANPLKQLSIVAEAISSGDLTNEVAPSKANDEIGKLNKGFSDMIKHLKSVISEVKDMSTETAASSSKMVAATEEVSKVSEQIATSVNELAKGASEQAIATESGNSKIIEVVTGLTDITRDMSKSEELAEKAKDTLEIGKKSVSFQSIKMKESKQETMDVSNAISALSDKSHEIGEILAVIESISGQTNLLSLNAAIEAARAGEHGKGFAVVAEEIRKLAEQSGLSVKRIDNIIKEVQSGVLDAVTEMKNAQIVVEEQEKALADTVNAFDDISEVVTEISNNIKNVSKVSKLLDSRAKEAGETISDISSISEETAAVTEEVAASTEEQNSVLQQIAESSEKLSELAANLQNSIEKFKL